MGTNKASEEPNGWVGWIVGAAEDCPAQGMSGPSGQLATCAGGWSEANPHLTTGPGAALETEHWL